MPYEPNEKVPNYHGFLEIIQKVQYLTKWESYHPWSLSSSHGLEIFQVLLYIVLGFNDKSFLEWKDVWVFLPNSSSQALCQKETMICFIKIEISFCV